MKETKTINVKYCDECPFLDHAHGDDPCHYCKIGDGEISFSKSSHMPNWCPLKNENYIISTDKKKR